MADREKVAEELLAIKAYFAGQAIEAKEEIIKEVFVEAQQTIENAISMLKEQEVVKPKIDAFGLPYCPKCKTLVYNTWEFCPHCGQELKWE